MRTRAGCGNRFHPVKLMLDIAHPKRGDTLQLPLMAEPAADTEPKAAPKPGPQNDLFGELKMKEVAN